METTLHHKIDSSVMSTENYLSSIGFRLMPDGCYKYSKNDIEVEILYTEEFIEHVILYNAGYSVYLLSQYTLEENESHSEVLNRLTMFRFINTL